MTQATLPRDSSGKLQAYAWPGGYPIFYLDRTDNLLCPACADEAESKASDWPQDVPVHAGIHWDGESMTCDACSAEMDSAYGPID